MTFTKTQGRYLAFIHAYTQLNGRAPAEADMQDYFRVTPPSVHRMVLELERRGLISRQPGVARSIRLTIPVADIPPLEAPDPVKIPVSRY
jgi:Mn-dependent DtxR family transcriptional regulator